MFVNLDPIVVLFLAWLVVILCFFVLAVQLFITLIEFKLTTLAGFVLVPFALWNKTSFLAEKVLGNVVSSGVKVLVLAVIVGIGSGLFAEFQTVPDEPSIDHALVVMLASLALLALGIFGPGIATGLVSGAPQLGAAGTGVAIGAAATGVGGAVMAGARMAPAAAKLASSGARAATSAASSAKSAFQAGSAAAGGGAKGAVAGLGNVAKTGAQAAGRRAASGASAAGQKVADSFRAGWNGTDAGAGAAGSGQAAAGEGADGAASAPKQEQPAWAKRMHRRQQITHAATTAAHTLRGGDGGGSGQGPSLRDSDS